MPLCRRRIIKINEIAYTPFVCLARGLPGFVRAGETEWGASSDRPLLMPRRGSQGKTDTLEDLLFCDLLCAIKIIFRYKKVNKIETRCLNIWLNTLV